MMPREKLITKGVEALTDDELLAIMLSSGSKNESVFTLSKRLIRDYGLERLCRMSYKELSKIGGIKEAKATKLISIFEITKRIMKHETSDIRLDTSMDLFNYLKADYAFLEYEMLTVIYTNSKLNVIKKQFITDKHASSIQFPIRKIVEDAIALSAYGIFICHNHPNGMLRPSEDDINQTESLKNVLLELGIHFFDHIIIARGLYYSFADDMSVSGM